MAKPAHQNCQASGQVSDLMTAEPITVQPDTAAADVFALMHERRIRHAPVVDEDGNLVGLVSQRDLIGYVHGTDQPPTGDWGGVTVADLMHERVDTVSQDCCSAEVARHMLRTKRSSLLVVDGAGRLVGIITEADFVRDAVRGKPACSCIAVQRAG